MREVRVWWVRSPVEKLTFFCLLCTQQRKEREFSLSGHINLFPSEKSFQGKKCRLSPPPLPVWPFDAMRKLGLPPFLSGKGVLRPPPATFLPSPSLAFCCCCCRGRRRRRRPPRRRRRVPFPRGLADAAEAPSLGGQKKALQREKGENAVPAVFCSGGIVIVLHGQKLYNEPSMTSTSTIK